MTISRVFYLGISVLLCSCATNQQSVIPTFKSDQWYDAIERKSGISDGEGHGPDRLSEEWCSALNRKVPLDQSVVSAPLCSDEWLHLIEKKLFMEKK